MRVLYSRWDVEFDAFDFEKSSPLEWSLLNSCSSGTDGRWFGLGLFIPDEDLS